MKVKMTRTGQVVEHNDSYAHRLIEHGKATPAPKGQAAKKPGAKAETKTEAVK